MLVDHTGNDQVGMATSPSAALESEWWNAAQGVSQVLERSDSRTWPTVFFFSFLFFL